MGTREYMATILQHPSWISQDFSGADHYGSFSCQRTSSTPSMSPYRCCQCPHAFDCPCIM